MSGSLPASRAPSANLSNSPSIFSSGAPTVMMPSACLPVRLALIGPAVATSTGGGVSGIVQSRVVSSVKNRPWCLTSLPATEASNSFLMTSMASNIRSDRSAASGQ